MSRSVEPRIDAPNGAVLEAVELGCIRGDRVLFNQLSFRLGAGKILQFEGENGSGKTSLLRILCGISLPDSGQVLWGGEEISRARSDYLAQIAYVGHAHGVKGELSALENLRVSCAISGCAPRVDYEHALEQIGLCGFEQVPCRNLSAGQRRRVALARLLVTGARLWFLDEPFTALDKNGIAMVEGLMESHTASGGMVALTTHHHLNLDRLSVTYLRLGT
jgi:heme exporter protein A